MSVLLQSPPELHTGDVLSRDEFLHRWESMPNTKFAELIGGVVFMPSPVGFDHATTDVRASTLLTTYVAETEGVDSGSNCTWLMLQDAPQPDCYLRIETGCGGHSHIANNYLHGAPELAVEVSGSSASFDLHQKLALYELAGVDEYLVVLMWEQEVRWFQRDQGRLELRDVPADGIVRSSVFPGLWLDTSAIVSRDIRRALSVLKQGLATGEYAQFVEQLAARRTHG